MKLMEAGYRLLRTKEAPQQKEMEHSSASLELRQIRTNAVDEMVTEKAVTMLPLGEKPWVVSLLGAMSEREINKFRLTVNIRDVNRHLGQKAFEFEGLKDLANLVEKGDHAVS